MGIVTAQKQFWELSCDPLSMKIRGLPSLNAEWKLHVQQYRAGKGEGLRAYTGEPPLGVGLCRYPTDNLDATHKKSED